MSQNAMMKRRAYLINRPFQLRVIIYTLIPVFVALISLWVVQDMYLQKQMQLGLSMGLTPDHGYFLLLQQQSQSLRSILLSAGAVISIFMVIWSLILSHKIAGPLHRLVRYLKDSKNGQKMQELKFRPNDFFQEIPEAMNSFIKEQKLD